jgi:hypothetical protein
MTRIPPSPTEEIRAIRHELAARFDNDLDRIVADLQGQQQKSGREYLTLKKRVPHRERTTNQALDASRDQVQKQR